MKFKHLVEYSSDISLEKWNKIQKYDWLKLVDAGLVEQNNTKTFIKFAKFFDSYYKKNKSFPSMKEVEAIL